MNDDQVLALATIIRHRDFVRLRLHRLVAELQRRAIAHDESKLTTDEILGFCRINRAAREHPYGSVEYNASMDSEKQPGGCISLHFSRNSHHPEFHGSADAMGFLDIIEMVIDWSAASATYGKTSLRDSLSKQRERFQFTDSQWWLIEQAVAWLEE